MGGKKGAPSKALAHPNSRKVRQLERQTRREERLNEKQKKRQAQSLLEAARFFWFREQCVALSQSRSAFSLEEARSLTEIYLNRNDEEVASLKSLRTPPAGRIKQIEALKTSEVGEFRSSNGIAIPDITDKNHVEILTKTWDGHVDTLRVVPRLRLSRGDHIAMAESMCGLEKYLKPIEQIREKAKEVAVAPMKVLKFQSQNRARSVKASSKLEDVALRSKLKGAERQQARLKQERKALLNARRVSE